MRNDDPEYVRDLEQSNQAMENEIKCLTLELAQRDRIIDELHRDNQDSTYMGEPLITINKSQLDAAWAKVEAAEQGERNAD